MPGNLRTCKIKVYCEKHELNLGMSFAIQNVQVSSMLLRSWKPGLEYISMTECIPGSLMF